MSESILGILMGVSAVFGMLGTFIYPIMRRRVGLVRTGLLALSTQVACLSLCVVSVWMPGSPFDPTFSSVPVALVHNATMVRTSQVCVCVCAGLMCMFVGLPWLTESEISFLSIIGLCHGGERR